MKCAVEAGFRIPQQNVYPATLVALIRMALTGYNSSGAIAWCDDRAKAGERSQAVPLMLT